MTGYSRPMMKLGGVGLITAHLGAGGLLVALIGCGPEVQIAPPGVISVECNQSASARLEVDRPALDLVRVRAVGQLVADSTVLAPVAIEFSDGAVVAACDVPGRGAVARVFFVMP